MRVRQSDIRTWARCPLQWRYENIDGIPRLQSGSLVFGSILHDVCMYLEVHQDLEGALARFKRFWAQPDQCPAPPGNPPYQIDYYERGRSWRKFADEGPRIIRDWWSLIQWDTDLTLAREYTFDVPIGDGHMLRGTVDKLVIRYNAKLGTGVVLVSDYKSGRKTPTYGFLEEDVQFSAYCYATTRPEFWANLPGGRGMELFEQYRHLPRFGEWVQLTGPKRMDAGERTERHYNRLAMAVDALALSVSMRIFVPNLDGDVCRFCDYRRRCGMPELED